MDKELSGVELNSVLLNPKYYISEYKREAMPDRTPFLYTQITDDLEKAMNRIPDKGAAIISNYLKMHDYTWAVQRMARDGKVLSVVFTNSPLITELKDDAQRSLINALSNMIGNEIIRWYDDEHDPGDLIPIYRSGLEHIPDSFIDMVDDVAMSYDQKECNYAVMVKPNIYTFCVNHKSYIRHMLSDIMKGKKIAFYDEAHSVIVIDKNEGKGPTVARAHAICCGVVFTLFGIINTTNAMKEYKERIKG